MSLACAVVVVGEKVGGEGRSSRAQQQSKIRLPDPAQAKDCALSFSHHLLHFLSPETWGLKVFSL